ncbi:MAG: ATP phosphoribosyltransferase regulatory subunit, partial [Elusimicrobia bacterium]|nr:ATP phosphoribosyltransferase regulatory subunit [Elusimicrobiota bacterium]
MQPFQAVRGVRDLLPAVALRYQRLEHIARVVFAREGYVEIRIPTFESVDLFARSLGATTDIVEKEMYTWEDRGGRRLALRPEGTAGVVRAFIQHHLHHDSPWVKLYYLGPMFRAERPQAGRFREFWQIGAESLGNASPVADAEVILLLDQVLA